MSCTLKKRASRVTHIRGISEYNLEFKKYFLI